MNGIDACGIPSGTTAMCAFETFKRRLESVESRCGAVALGRAGPFLPPSVRRCLDGSWPTLKIRGQHPEALLAETSRQPDSPTIWSVKLRLVARWTYSNASASWQQLKSY